MTSVTGPTATRCQMSISNSAPGFGPSGGSGTVTVSVARECTWGATSQASWIQLTGAKNGQGDGTVPYTVAANGDPVARRASIAILDQHADIAQDAAPCQYDVSGPPAPLAATGGQAGIDVRTHPACAWTAVSTSSWASVSPLDGKGTATVTATVLPNSGAERTVTLFVGPDRIELRQLAAPVPDPAPSPDPPPSPTPPPPDPGPAPDPGPSPDPAPTVQLSGKVAHLGGSCPSLHFTLQDSLVYTNSSTDFQQGHCKDVKNDRKVSVTGTRQLDGTVLASVVVIEK